MMRFLPQYWFIGLLIMGCSNTKMNKRFEPRDPLVAKCISKNDLDEIRSLYARSFSNKEIRNCYLFPLFLSTKFDCTGLFIFGYNYDPRKDEDFPFAPIPILVSEGQVFLYPGSKAEAEKILIRFRAKYGKTFDKFMLQTIESSYSIGVLDLPIH